jgi:hypothetical protein
MLLSAHFRAPGLLQQGQRSGGQAHDGQPYLVCVSELGASLELPAHADVNFDDGSETLGILSLEESGVAVKSVDCEVMIPESDSYDAHALASLVGRVRKMTSLLKAQDEDSSWTLSVAEGHAWLRDRVESSVMCAWGVAAADVDSDEGVD